MPRAMRYADVSQTDITNYNLYAHKYGWNDCWTVPPEEGFQFLHDDRRRFFYLMGLQADVPAKTKIIKCKINAECFRPDHQEVR